jgi:acyl dehydratase
MSSKSLDADGKPASSQIHRFESLAEGTKYSFSYLLDAKVYEGFLALFGDANPLHTDSATAKESGFDGPVMHGAILNGFQSNFIGMHFPGRDSMLLSTRISYVSPCFLGDTIRLTAQVIQRIESQNVVVLDFDFRCENRSRRVARGVAMVKIRCVQ